ncbi:LysR substrate-binding domain-containing protein [Defluviimonas sp. WL0050]|uniref:LysR substrate-binding domain-containing protein n=1 Tax=Albidovulum litorale TaxID=2984134 RepID=A0ABT2ZK07_9RHOB|nr:LysR substrate-binding domain-containing protein [Defluviimonas sp. WL0050]MCV2871451.1 LysR substrate-binding domain-containing protein [Defluviimonas sp. WL0050]
MRYVQLRAFHHVAIFGGFSRAAEALHLTQPAISDQVRKLEEEYDVLLFNRHKRQVSLTPQGERLLEITRRLFDSESQALDLLSEARALRSGALRIVADSAHHLLHILARFRDRYPGVRITVHAGNTESVLDALYAYEADIGVLGNMPDSRDIEALKLNSTPITAFVARDHPVARRSSLTFRDLAGLPLVFREEGSRTRAKLEETARAAGVVLTPAIEAEGREAVREIVASGAGVGFVSAAEFGSDARLVSIPIEAGAAMVMDEALICLRERKAGKLVQAFFEVAAEMASG